MPRWRRLRSMSVGDSGVSRNMIDDVIRYSIVETAAADMFGVILTLLAGITPEVEDITCCWSFWRSKS